MYFYIHDKFVNDKKNAKKLGQMNVKLNELGIFSDKTEVNTITTIESAVENVLASQRYKHIIAVGGDETAHRVFNTFLKSRMYNPRLIFGIIPFCPSRIAESLGIPNDVEKACLTISRRKLETVDVGFTSDGTYFLNSLDITRRRLLNNGKTFTKLKNIFSRNKKEPEVTISIRNYKIITSEEKISIINALDNEWKKMLAKQQDFKSQNINPQDGTLNLVIGDSTDKKEGEAFTKVSLFPARTLAIDSPDKITIIADHTRKINAPLKVTVKLKLMNVIVGKERGF